MKILDSQDIKYSKSKNAEILYNELFAEEKLRLRGYYWENCSVCCGSGVIETNLHVYVCSECSYQGGQWIKGAEYYSI